MNVKKTRKAMYGCALAALVCLIESSCVSAKDFSSSPAEKEIQEAALGWCARTCPRRRRIQSRRAIFVIFIAACLLTIGMASSTPYYCGWGPRPNGEGHAGITIAECNTFGRGNHGCTKLGFLHLGLIAALLMTIQWVGLTRRVRKGKAGGYKDTRIFVLPFLLLVAQVGMVQTEPRYQCSSSSDCDFPGCNNVPCSSDSQGCVNDIWTNWQCNKYNLFTAQSCVEGGCGCYYGEYDGIQLYTGVCPGRPCLNGTYGALGDGFQKWLDTGGWGPRSTCTPCEAGKALSSPLLSLPLSFSSPPPSPCACCRGRVRVLGAVWVVWQLQQRQRWWRVGGGAGLL